MSHENQGTLDRRAFAEGELLARPRLRGGTDTHTGLQPLGLESGRDGLLYVPISYRPDHPAPLALMLHGAGGEARGGLTSLQQLADEASLILLAPDSRLQTWDIIHGAYGLDVAYINAALDVTFSRYNVDPLHLAIGGFSDGASYALSLGITNGELFSHIIAFSPGFMAPAAQRGAPRIFISHGTGDRVLPIDVCSRKLAPRLQDAGYDVVYLEFEGGHTVPEAIAGEAMRWFLNPQGV